MTGSLQTKNGKYFAVINAKDEFGKRKPTWISMDLSTAGNNKRKAEKALRDILKNYEDKKVYATNVKYFYVYITEWLEGMKMQVEENTWYSYEYAMRNHAIPYFTRTKVMLQDIEPNDIQKYYALKLKEGLSPNTIKRHHCNIRKALQDAMLLNIIPYNPADRVKLPKVNKYVASFYNAEQVGKLLDVVKGTNIEAPVLLCAYYGLRRSEVLGLKWESVDFTNNAIAINNTVVYNKHIIEKKRTKTQSSNRMLPIMEAVESYLKRLKRHQKEMKLLQGTSYTDNDFVCKWDDGRPLNPNYLSKTFNNLLMKNDLPVIRFHDLRHSCASILSATGCDIKKISEWLGHSDISTTANLYTHLEFKSKIEIGNSIENELKQVQ